MPAAWNRPNNPMAAKKAVVKRIDRPDPGAVADAHPSRAIPGLGHTRFHLSNPRKQAKKGRTDGE